MELKRVVVTGLGAITPLGNNVEETWKNLLAGKSGAGPITHFNAEKFKAQFACEVKGFNAEEYGIDRKEARKMDIYTQYAIAAAQQAIADSQVDLEAIDKNRVGVVFGVGIGGIKTFEEEIGAYARTGAEIGPKFGPFFIQDDCRHRRRPHQHPLWLPWSQLRDHLRMCLQHQCTG